MQQGSSSAQDVLPLPLQLLLQNESCQRVSRQDCALLKLMTTSSTMRAAVAELCSKRVTLEFTSAARDSLSLSVFKDLRHLIHKQEGRERSFAAWLVKHMHLVKALHIAPTLSEFGSQYLAPALDAVTASGQAKHLASFSSDESHNNDLDVLRSLPASSLTHLRMCITDSVPQPGLPVYATADGKDAEPFPGLHGGPGLHSAWTHTTGGEQTQQLCIRCRPCSWSAIQVAPQYIMLVCSNILFLPWLGLGGMFSCTGSAFGSLACSLKVPRRQ